MLLNRYVCSRNDDPRSCVGTFDLGDAARAIRAGQRLSARSAALTTLTDDQPWGINRRREGGDHTLSALKSIRAARPDGAPIYVIMDNLSANTTPAVRKWAAANKVSSA